MPSDQGEEKRDTSNEEGAEVKRAVLPHLRCRERRLDGRRLSSCNGSYSVLIQWCFKQDHWAWTNCIRTVNDSNHPYMQVIIVCGIIRQERVIYWPSEVNGKFPQASWSEASFYRSSQLRLIVRSWTRGKSKTRRGFVSEARRPTSCPWQDQLPS